MRILVIDAQGGGIGKQLVTAIKKALPGIELNAVGTNAAATEAMRKAGADRVATGENAVIVSTRNTDVITGPFGICIADAMMGEISPAMAAAVGQSKAVRVLLPFQNCNTIVAGVPKKGMAKLVEAAVEEIGGIVNAERLNR